MSIKIKEWLLFGFMLVLFLPAFGYVCYFIYSVGINVGSYMRTLMIFPLFLMS